MGNSNVIFCRKKSVKVLSLNKQWYQIFYMKRITIKLIFGLGKRSIMHLMNRLFRTIASLKFCQDGALVRSREKHIG